MRFVHAVFHSGHAVHGILVYIQCLTAHLKKKALILTFSPLVNTAAISETSNDSGPARHTDAPTDISRNSCPQAFGSMAAC